MKFEPGEVNIICSDVAKSLHFYRDVLGFVPTVDSDGFYHLKAGMHQVLLLPIARPVEDVPPYGSTPQISVDLYVDDIAAAYKYFKEQQVIFAQELTTGRRSFVIRDPDGLPWEVIERGNHDLSSGTD